ncbi:MAG: STAS domain-containing protein [Candidatus Peregrinibacteria bacterium]
MAAYQVSLIDVPNKDHLKVIYLSGEIDGETVDAFRESLNNALHEERTQGTKCFIFHLRDLEFINSTVIGYFADMYTRLSQEDKKIIFSEGNQHILDILDLVGFLSLVEHYGSLRDAIASTDL